MNAHGVKGGSGTPRTPPKSASGNRVQTDNQQDIQLYLELSNPKMIIVKLYRAYGMEPERHMSHREPWRTCVCTVRMRAVSFPDSPVHARTGGSGNETSMRVIPRKNGRPDVWPSWEGALDLGNGAVSEKSVTFAAHARRGLIIVRALGV